MGYIHSYCEFISVVTLAHLVELIVFSEQMKEKHKENARVSQMYETVLVYWLHNRVGKSNGHRLGWSTPLGKVSASWI